MARRTTTRKKTARHDSTHSVLLSRSVMCSMLGISERQLSVWEHEDFIAPVRISEAGGHREPLYEPGALERARLIRTLAEDLEVNLPGIGVILHLLEQLDR